MRTYPEIECEACHSFDFPPLEDRSKLAFEWKKDLYQESGFESDHTHGLVKPKDDIPFYYQPAS